jgi:hypothetical protein
LEINMPAYLVTLDRTKSGHSLRHGGNAMVVFATSATAAKEIAAAQHDGDGLAWANDATATEITAATANDYNGWTFVINIQSLANGTFTLVGDATTNTIDEIGAALVVLLNAHASIANAAYDTTTQVLTIAGAADNLGANQIDVTITPPSGKSSIPSLVGTIVDGGVANAALSVVLPADAAVIPRVLATLKQVE